MTDLATTRANFEPRRSPRASAAPLCALLLGCAGGGPLGPDGEQGTAQASPGAAREAGAAVARPFPDARRVDHLIEPDETRFLELYQLTFGGENAEAYWSFAGDRLVLQRRHPVEGVDCDRIYVLDDGELTQVSSGRGVTTCAYFLPGDREVLFASTHGEHASCPAPPDRSKGYVWKLHPEYEVYVVDLESGTERQLTDAPGYDAEGTVSPLGDRIVFTSVRSGDPELWTCDLAGGALHQVTDSPGYDGGAFFSHGGDRLIWRATAFTPGAEADEQAAFAQLLEEHLVRPSAMELVTSLVDGTLRRTLTSLGGANWAPYFTPDDRHVLFSSNHHVGPRSRNFDLFLVPSEGGPHGAESAERVTTYEGFDSFPMFHPRGEWLAFSSNRGGSVEGETNVFLARWRAD